MTKLLVAVICTAVAAPRLAHAQAAQDVLTYLSPDASSTLKGKKDAYAAWRVVDSDVEAAMDLVFHTTGWCEGKKDAGIGEYISFGGEDLSFTKLTIYAGYWKSDKLFAANNKPTKLTIIITGHDGNQTTKDVDVPPEMQPVDVDLGEGVDIDQLKIVIADVQKGKVNDTCISHIDFWNGDTMKKPFLDTGAAAQDLLSFISDLNTALGACDAAALKTLVKFPLAYKGMPDPAGMTKATKAKYKNAAALAKACKKGAGPAAGGDMDYSLIGIERGGYTYRVGPSNEMGSVTWHLTYTPSPDVPESGTWRLTAVDY